MLKQSFSNIISEMNRNDTYCQGASQQMANGFYRVFDALELIANDLDEDNKKSTEINSIRSSLNMNNSYCQGAPQQAANGSYRIVEILQVIISLLDHDDSYASKTQAILSTMSSNNTYCQGAPQQTANASYRIVEMLDIITEILAPEQTASVSSCISEMNRVNAYCQGAPQQSANGTDTAFVILQSIVSSLDTEKKYGSSLSNLVSLKARNNAYCQGADQQSANNIYRIMETIQILGDIMDDNAIRKIEAYWEEHQEEYAQLNTEKNNCQNAIREIQSRADKVNADDEIKPLEKEIRTLENEKNLFGAKELTDLGNIVAELKKERANLGIFKFAMRKEATQKINEAEANYSAKQRVITSEKNKIQGEINKLQSKIKTYENQVQKEKSKILEECVPHQARIEQIDRELTKKR